MRNIFWQKGWGLCEDMICFLRALRAILELKIEVYVSESSCSFKAKLCRKYMKKATGFG